ncbi:MAG: aldehyde ferredoxin oxidoreductase, partial [Deltaproteobacteria bacterium]
MQGKWYGWAGKIIELDLTSKKILVKPLSRDLAERFVGGRGINMKFLFDEIKPNTDPLGPENVLIFGTGPLTGTIVGSRTQVSTKAPMTGFLGDSNSGGHWGAELKFAGYDHIIIKGRSEKPVYLFIDDDEIEIRDASHLWGKNIWEVTDIIRDEESDSEIQVLGIGLAGENLVRFAAIMNTFSRANGRTGVGAVMGSKRLKCIAVRGTKGVSIADPERFLNHIKEIYQKATTSPMFDHYPVYGTPILTDMKAELGNLPVKNWSDITIEGVENVTGKALVEKYAQKNRACYGCFYHCDHFFMVKEGKYQGVIGPGLEYESVNGLGPRIGNTDFPTILHGINIVNDYGLDVVSTGGSIALAMDLYERGIITEKDTGGIPIRWGDGDVIIDLIHKIAKREGFGDLLAEGPYYMAKKIGK